MKQNGVQFTCDGCGITTFIESVGFKNQNLKPSHNVVGMLQPNQSESWARVDLRFDLCPACQTCDTLYDIKQGLEQLNVMLNMLKDIELYKTPTLAGHKSGLENLCIDGGANCAGPWELDAVEVGRQLLQQYTTVVHMWNYAVLQNNSSLKLEIAPEDTAGFVVQTKRALPSCDESMQIKCTITVSYDAVVPDPQRPSETQTAAPSKQLLSVLIPSPILRFKPFTLEETVDDVDITAGGSMRDGEENTKHIAALQNIDIQVIDDPDYTTKTITTGWITAKIAGTYEFTVKVLPFIHCVMTDDQGNVISVRGGDIRLSRTRTIIPKSKELSKQKDLRSSLPFPKTHTR